MDRLWLETVSMLVVISLMCCSSVEAVDPEIRKENEETTCKSGQIKCSDDPLECIDKDLACNGVSECTNGADESVLMCGCLPNEFQCNSTSCIDVIKRCDRRSDCQNNEDELNCETYTCLVTHSKCANHFCVPLDAVCNYVNDCGDNSDEEKCPYRSCYSTEFPCSDRQCLPIGMLCDGVANCLDGSDEIRCDEHFRCADGFYVLKDRVCDGWAECYDGHTDETNCGNCTKDQFRCSNGRCIRKSNVCDGECDCFYTCEDEQECESIDCPIGDNYRCRDNNRCIAKEYMCDGINDCFNSDLGADEFFCKTNSSECDTSNHIWCPEGRCLPASDIHSVKCDHWVDCLNGEDEEDCDYKPCNSSQYQCDNGQCIPYRKRCDGGKPDCYDRSDELDCEAHSCPYSTIRCHTGQCIPHEYECDFINDCPDFSDENGCTLRKCTSKEFQCANGQCIDKRFLCYSGKDVGRNGCADNSHLMNCSNFSCAPGQFKCPLSYCIAQSEVCDNHIDCKMTFTDEENCAFRCPHPELTCTCIGYRMDCMNLNLTRLPHDLTQEDMTKYDLGGNNLTITETTFSALSKLTYLDINNNGIDYIPDGSFKFLWRLMALNLENNRLELINNGTFQGLTNLRTVYLSGNMIREIAPQGFIGMSQLYALNLSYQDLRNIESNTFLGLRNVRTLNLSHNHISHIAEGAFNGLLNILSMDLSHNTILMVQKNVFHGLKHMTYLDISINTIEVMEENVFIGLHRLNELITDEFRFCCAAKMTGRCLPEPDEFSSCTDLMSNYVLRVSIWILGLVAFWGNLVVVVWRTRDLRNGKVHSFLITNLAIGDFFMGVYMLIIAVVDSYYRGNYILYDRIWRESDLCKFAGMISTFSSELSVFTLTVITLDRLICIIFPLHLRRLKLRDAFYVMMFIWMLVIAIASFPLIGMDYFENFYGRSGVCLAFHITNLKPKGWEYSVAVFLVLNLASFLVIFFSYLRMFFVAKQTRSAVRKTQDKNDYAMAKRMTMIVMTDFFCWVPIILLGFASLGGAKIPPEVYAWVAVFVLPLNSAINPVLYTISTAPFLRNFRKRASYFRKSFTASTKNETKHSFLEDRSSHVWDRKPIYRNLELMRMKSVNSKSMSSHSRSSHSENLM